VRLSLQHGENGQAFLIHTVFRDRDFMGRPRTSFSHILADRRLPRYVFDDQRSVAVPVGWLGHAPTDSQQNDQTRRSPAAVQAFSPLAALRTWASNDWVWLNEHVRDKTLPVRSDLPAGTCLTDDHLTHMLRGEPLAAASAALEVTPATWCELSQDCRGELLRSVLAHYLAVAQGERPRLCLVAVPGVATMLIYAIARLLPPSFTNRLTFSTYERADERLKRLPVQVVSTLWGDRKKELGNDYAQQLGFTLNTFTQRGVRSRHEIPQFVDLMSQLAIEGDWAKVDRLLQRCAVIGTDKTEALDRVVQFTRQVESQPVAQWPPRQVDSLIDSAGDLGLALLVEEPEGRTQLLERVLQSRPSDTAVCRRVIRAVRASRHADAWIGALRERLLPDAQQRGSLAQAIQDGDVDQVKFLTELILQVGAVVPAPAILVQHTSPATLPPQSRALLLDLDSTLFDGAPSVRVWLRTSSSRELRDLCRREITVRWKIDAVQHALRHGWENDEPVDPVVVDLLHQEPGLAGELVQSMATWHSDGKFEPRRVAVRLLRACPDEDRMALYDHFLQRIDRFPRGIWRESFDEMTQFCLETQGYPGHAFLRRYGAVLSDVLGTKSRAIKTLCTQCVENLNSRCLDERPNEQTEALRFAARLLNADIDLDSTSSSIRPAATDSTASRTMESSAPCDAARRKVAAWQTLMKYTGRDGSLPESSDDYVELAAAAQLLRGQVGTEVAARLARSFLGRLAFPTGPLPNTTKHILEIGLQLLGENQLCREIATLSTGRTRPRGAWIAGMLRYVVMMGRQGNLDPTKVDALLETIRPLLDETLWKETVDAWDNIDPRPWSERILLSFRRHHPTQPDIEPLASQPGRVAVRRNPRRWPLRLGYGVLIVVLIGLFSWGYRNRKFLGESLGRRAIERQTTPSNASKTGRPSEATRSEQGPTTPNQATTSSAAAAKPPNKHTANTPPGDWSTQTDVGTTVQRKTTGKAEAQQPGQPTMEPKDPESEKAPPRAVNQPTDSATAPPAARATIDRPGAEPPSPPRGRPQPDPSTATSSPPLLEFDALRKLNSGGPASAGLTNAMIVVQLLGAQSKNVALPPLHLGENHWLDVQSVTKSVEDTFGVKLNSRSKTRDPDTLVQVASYHETTLSPDWKRPKHDAECRSLLEAKPVPVFPELYEFPWLGRPFVHKDGLLKVEGTYVKQDSESVNDVHYSYIVLTDGTPKKETHFYFMERKDNLDKTYLMSNKREIDGAIRTLDSESAKRQSQVSVTARLEHLCWYKVLHLKVNREGFPSRYKSLKDKLANRPAKDWYVLSRWAADRGLEEKAGEAIAQARSLLRAQAVELAQARAQVATQFGPPSLVVRIHFADQIREQLYYAGDDLLDPACIELSLHSQTAQLSSDPDLRVVPRLAQSPE
jgi:hypothetical protein